MTLINKMLNLPEQAASPSAVNSTFGGVYVKADGLLYWMDDALVERAVGIVPTGLANPDQSWKKDELNIAAATTANHLFRVNSTTNQGLASASTGTEFGVWSFKSASAAASQINVFTHVGYNHAGGSVYEMKLKPVAAFTGFANVDGFYGFNNENSLPPTAPYMGFKQVGLALYAETKTASATDTSALLWTMTGDVEYVLRYVVNASNTSVRFDVLSSAGVVLATTTLSAIDMVTTRTRPYAFCEHTGTAYGSAAEIMRLDSIGFGHANGFILANGRNP